MWVPQDNVMSSALLNCLLRLSPFNVLDAGIDITSSDGVSLYTTANHHESSPTTAGLLFLTANLPLSAGVYRSSPPAGTANLYVYDGANWGIIRCTVGIAGSGADIIVNDMTGASMTAIVDFTLDAPLGDSGTVLSTKARNELIRGLRGGSTSYFSGNYHNLLLYSGVMPSTVPDTLAGYAPGGYLGQFGGVFEVAPASPQYMIFAPTVTGVIAAGTSWNDGPVNQITFTTAGGVSGTAAWGLLVRGTDVVLATRCGTSNAPIILTSTTVVNGNDSNRVSQFQLSLT